MAQINGKNEPTHLFMTAIPCSGKAGHDQQMYCASLVCLGFYAFLSFSYNNDKTVLITNYCFCLFSPLGGGRGSGCIVLSCHLALNHNIQAQKPESCVLLETI